MKLSKSILSPGRAAPVSLSTSLSRKLRTNGIGSLKGGASPFFTTPGKKRGCAFENPEPSSPKVTCIGQVRVKTKKRVSSLSRRRSGEISFRKLEQGGQAQQNEDRFCSQNHQQDCLPPHRNQRWVHLPVTICEALRSFGAEFSCLFPCKSSCFSTSERKKEEKRNGSNGDDNGQRSCAALFARWLVSVKDGEGGKRREIELVIDENKMRMNLKEGMSMRSSRRHVLENIEIKDDKIEVKGQSVEGEEEAGRVGICIPPKNALLLMRCRSDPLKMADLANRFSWDANAASKYEDVDEEIEIEIENEDIEEEFEVQEREDADELYDEISEPNVGVSVQQEIPAELESELPENVGELQKLEELLHKTEQEPEVEDDKLIEEEVESNMSSFEPLLDQENAERCEEDGGKIQREEVEEPNPPCNSSSSAESDEEQEDGGSTQESARYEEEAALNKLEENQEETTIRKNSLQVEEEGNGAESIESEAQGQENQEFNKEKESQALPECLLLMMCEPKLSMEVSKETWVCSTDFLRWLPERPLKAANKKPTKKRGREHESIMKKLIADSKPNPVSLPLQNNSDNILKHLQQRPRSSCSLPAAAAAASMATMIEQKLVNAVGYEPFVLARCKSEPMRMAASKLMPESCFWKNSMRKLEPHRRATFGVGAAGVGF